MQRFSAAPWPTFLKITSGIGAVLLLAAGYAAFRAIPRGTRVPFAEKFGVVVAAAPPAIAIVAALFVVSGYELAGHALRVRRLLWTTSLSLDGLRSAWHDPSAMKCSLRLFGNGGLFSVTGLYRNRALGRYRAFVTDPARAVVLLLHNRVVVVSPSDPAAFLDQLRGAFPGIRDGPDRGGA